MTATPDLGPDATTAALPGGPNSEGQKSRPVRVPNVSPDAKSGIDGEVIGSNAQEAYDATADQGDEQVTDPQPDEGGDGSQEQQEPDQGDGSGTDAPESTDTPDEPQTGPDGVEEPGNPDLAGNGEGVPSDGDGVPAT